MAEHERHDARARCERRCRRQRQGAGPDFDGDPRPPACAWVRSPHGTRQRKPCRDEPPRHAGPPAPCASCPLGEEAARKRWHVRIGMAGAFAIPLRNAQATARVGSQQRANHGLRGAARSWHRFGLLPGTDSTSQALRCPPDAAALSRGCSAGPHERPHLPSARPDTLISGNWRRLGQRTGWKDGSGQSERSLKGPV